MGIIENRLKEYDKDRKIFEHLKIVNYVDYDEPYIYDVETNEYFNDVDAMDTYYKENKLEMPKYAYGVYFKSIELDLDCILEDACEEHHEDALYSLDCVEDLRKAINQFNEDNKGNGSYFEDTNTIIELF